MNLHSEKFFLFIFLFAIACLHLSIAFVSDTTYDTGDGIQHFLISKFSWKHPELFLHLWGKPFFTLISSSFTQFGLTGAHFFNIFCAVFTGYFCYKIAKKLELSRSLFAILFFCFSPVYFGAVQSGLTEPLFGFLLILCIALFLNEKFFLSALLISFLPFVRTEGNLILPLFFFILVYRKKYFFIPLLLTGTVMYSLAGYFYYNDALWLLHQNPYKGAAALYGKGEWYHFILRSEFIWGLPVFLLLVAGFVHLFISTKCEKKTEELVLVYGSFFVYFMAHAIFWWKGWFGSMGLIRVMAAITPVAALIALRGLNFSVVFLPGKRTQQIFPYSLILLVPAICFAHYYFSMERKKEETSVIKKATGWLMQSEYHQRKIYYLHPLVSLELAHDRFDRSTNGELWSIHPEKPEIDLNAGDILLWDSHFAPREGNIKPETLMNNPYFQLLKEYSADNKLKNEKIEILIFERK